MSKSFLYKGDKNKVVLTGEVHDIPEYCQYIPRPMIKFNLHSYRKQRGEDVVFDLNTVVLFDHEDFYKVAIPGMRIEVEGELQSRNFVRDNYEVSDTIKFSVANYLTFTNTFPTKMDPKGKKRQPILWSKLLQYGLVPEVPEDSMFDENGVKRKSQESPYLYSVDENGDVFKSTEHVSYEIISNTFKFIEEPLDPAVGDINRIDLIGRVTRNPYFDYVGNETKVPFCSFNIRTESEFFEGRFFYNNIISWGDVASEGLQSLGKDSLVRVKGRIQSRTYQKELRKKWKSASGKPKKKKTIVDVITREVSASKLIPLHAPKKDEK